MNFIRNHEVFGYFFFDISWQKRSLDKQKPSLCKESVRGGLWHDGRKEVSPYYDKLLHKVLACHVFRCTLYI